MSGARERPDLYARSQESASRHRIIAAFGLLTACSLELPGTGVSPEGVVSDPGPVVTEGGQPANGGRAPRRPAEVLDAQAADPGAPALRDAGAGASAPDATTSTSTPSPTLDAGQALGCQLDGSYALRVAFDVSWVGTQFAGIVPVIDAGQGELSFTVLMKLNSSGGELSSSFRTCASEVPEFTATITRERYQAHFRDEVWDAPTMPVFQGTVESSCREPGCKVTFSPLMALIGASLSPATAPWPERAADGTWPDHDGDGAPGIAVEMLGGQRGQGNYAYPPLDLLTLRRVPSLGLGLRVIVALDGALTSCDALEGATLESSVETRAASCEAQPGNNPNCTSAELTFLNENLPVWTVREGEFEAKRIAPDADCKTVRRTFPSRR